MDATIMCVCSMWYNFTWKDISYHADWQVKKCSHWHCLSGCNGKMEQRHCITIILPVLIIEHTQQQRSLCKKLNVIAKFSYICSTRKDAVCTLYTLQSIFLCIIHEYNCVASCQKKISGNFCFQLAQKREKERGKERVDFAKSQNRWTEKKSL